MGCLFSKPTFTVDELIIGRSLKAYQFFEELFLTKEDLNILFSAFCDIDADGSNIIRSDELFAYFNVEDTPCNRKIFGFLSEEEDVYLSILDFVVVMWNFLTIESFDICRFVFVLFDTDATGNLEHNEIIELIKKIHFHSHETNKAVKIVIEKLVLQKPVFNLETFVDWTRTHSSLMNPILTLQYEIQRRLIGVRFWTGLIERRKQSKEFADINFLAPLAKKVKSIKEEQKREIYKLRLEEKRLINLKNMQRLSKKYSVRTLAKFKLVNTPKPKHKVGYFESTSELKVDQNDYDAALAKGEVKKEAFAKKRKEKPKEKGPDSAKHSTQKNEENTNATSASLKKPSSDNLKELELPKDSSSNTNTPTSKGRKRLPEINSQSKSTKESSDVRDSPSTESTKSRQRKSEIRASSKNKYPETPPTDHSTASSENNAETGDDVKLKDIASLPTQKRRRKSIFRPKLVRDEQNPTETKKNPKKGAKVFDSIAS